MDRRHPDLFDEAEAVAYLHLPADTGPRTLETYREKGWLVGHPHGRALVYHRDDLDLCALRIVNRAPKPAPSEAGAAGRSARREAGPRLRFNHKPAGLAGR